MVSIVVGSILIECDCCCFISTSTIRLLKKMITETIKSNATKMINKIQAFFLMCVAIIKKILYGKLVQDASCLQIWSWTIRSREMDKC